MNNPAFAAISTCVVLLIMKTPRLEWTAIKYLCDVDVLEICACSLRDPLLVHEAGHVRRDNVLGAMPKVIVHLVEAHSCRYSFVGHTECAPKTAAVIRTVHRHKYQAFYFLE